MANTADRIAIIGAGNLAWHLSGVLGDRCVVVSRSGRNGLDWPVAVIPPDKLHGYNLFAIILAVPDDAIHPVSERLAAKGYAPTLPIVHTSGATPVDRIAGHFRRRGVLWPIRSLRRGEGVTDWRDLPLVIFGENEEATAYVSNLASSLSDTVTKLNDDQRARLHLAAVFSNNFVTALYEVAYRLCREHDIPFELLLPIIRHTAAGQDGTQPARRQTGAAVRGDEVTMRRHLNLLSQPRYKGLYRDISALILQHRLTEHHADLGAQADDNFDDERVA